MKKIWLVLLLVMPAGMRGQQMPGMPMPATEPAGKSAPVKPAPKPVQKPAAGGAPLPSMPGMQSDPAGAETPKPVPLGGSAQRATGEMQEPESPERRTGSRVPAPELLGEVSKRQARGLAEFLAGADRLNPTLRQSKALVERSAAQARQAGLYPNPTVGYQGEQIRGGSFGGGEQGGFVEQTVVLGGKLGLRREVYEQQRQSDQIGAEEQRVRVHGAVTQGFYAALASQAMVEVRRGLVRVAEDAVETVHQLANVGQADAPDVLQTEVEAEQAKIDLLAAEREFLASARVLNAQCGLTATEVTPLAGSLDAVPEVDAEARVAAMASGSPTVRRMRQQVAVSEARLRAAKREAVPDLQLRAGEQQNLEHLGTTPVTNVGLQSFATVGVSLPLWNRNQGNVQVAEAELERSRQEVTRSELRLRQTAEPIAESYLAARFTAERYRTELIPRAERAYQLYLTKYQSMASAYPQVLVSQRTLFQLRIGYLTALRDAWTAAVALENYTLDGGLEAPDGAGGSTQVNPPNSGPGTME